MANIALVICAKENLEQRGKTIIGRCCSWFKNLFVPLKDQITCQRLEASSDTGCSLSSESSPVANSESAAIFSKASAFPAFENATQPKVELAPYLLRLPYSLNLLKNSGRRKIHAIDEFITSFIGDNAIEACILPAKIADVHLFKGCVKSAFNGSILYKALLLDILDLICRSGDIKVSELDITIVQGESGEELSAVLSQLSPVIKYAAVLSDDKKTLEQDLDRIYEDTGLAVGITSDYTGALKNSNLIINLKKSRFPFNRSKSGSSAIILNYGCQDTSGFPGENIIINGLEIDLPAKMAPVFDSSVFEYFSKMEIAEIILCYKTGIKNAFDSNTIEHKFFRSLSDGFRRDGFRIRGFKGRHVSFRAEDIKW